MIRSLTSRRLASSIARFGASQSAVSAQHLPRQSSAASLGSSWWHATGAAGDWSADSMRNFSSSASSEESLSKLRNIGISAHIDSGKTTLTERILYYTGRIDSIHDVRGKDGVGAKMDSMDLEREKGITIQSAATYCTWGENHINIIDTPGHVDFTVEVERALRVLDGAVLVLCGVSGVQSQSITVDRQMKRYNVPRVAFINKLDRMGANPTKVIRDLRSKLRLNAVALQLPVGLEAAHEGIIDVVRQKQILFKGDNGETIVESDVPADKIDAVTEARREIVERLADVDEDMEMHFLEETMPEDAELVAAIRKATVARELCPVFLGSAFKNKGVQALLDGVVTYLPNPTEVRNIALDRKNAEAEVVLAHDADKPLVALAFKLEESRFGQLTYFRIYQGTLKKSTQILNVDKSSKHKVPRLVRMHSNEMEDVDSVGPGEIVATFGVECASGDTFTDGSVHYAMETMFVPEPVISYSVKPKGTGQSDKFGRALGRFQREDPTFRVHTDGETGETIISGMGELHLDIYVERLKREYEMEVTTGEPRVNFRETISSKGEFNYLHKKQSGGAGQYGRVMGYIEPMPEDSEENFEFVNGIVGNAITPDYISACKKGFEECMKTGALTGHPVQGVRVVLTDGQDHPVDSSDLAFRAAARGGFRQAFHAAKGQVLEPVMDVEVMVPMEFQGTAIGLLNKRKGQLYNQEAGDMTVTLHCYVPLASMFGFSTDLRSATQGKGEFTMEYLKHEPVMGDVQKQLMDDYKNGKGKDED